MGDVAVLGLAIDSSQATAAAAALDRFAAAAKPAAAAAAAVETSAKPASAALNNHATASTAAARAHAGMSVQAMAAQHSIRSMIESVALGIPPTQALTAQMNHLAFAASGPGGLKGAFGEAFAALRGFISPTALVIGGLAAVAGASILTYEAIKKTELEFGALSDRAMLSVTSLHSLASAAAFKGVGQDDFLKQMGQFSELTYQAQHNVGSMAELFRANGVAVGSVNDNLMRAADLIRGAKDDATRYVLVQQLGLPATREWVEFLKQGSEGIKAATDEAVKFGGTADEKLIAKARRFDEEWAKAWQNFTTGAKGAFVTAGDYLSGFGDAVTRTLMHIGVDVPRNLLGAGLAGSTSVQSTRLGPNSNVGQFYQGIGAFNPPAAGGVGVGGRGGPTVDPNDIKKRAADYAALVGALGPLASVEQQATARQLELNAAQINNKRISADAIARIVEYTRESALGLTQIRANTDALNVQAASFGMTAGDAAAYAAVQTRINEAIRVGNPLRADQVAKLREEAGALGEATTRLQNMNDASSILSSGFRTFRDEVQNGSTALQALGKMATSVLNSIEDKLIDMASRQLVAAAFGGGGGGIFGSIGSLFTGSATVATHHTGYGPGDALRGSRMVDPSVFAFAPRFHTGIGPGERAALIRDDESVLTPGQMRQLAPVGGAGGAGPITVNITNAPAGTTANVSASRDARGMRLDVAFQRQVDDQAAALVSSGQSAMNNAIERRYGLTPKL